VRSAPDRPAEAVGGPSSVAAIVAAPAVVAAMPSGHEGAGQLQKQASGVGEWLAHIYSVNRAGASTERGEEAALIALPAAAVAADASPTAEERAALAVPADFCGLWPASSHADVMQVHLAVPERFVNAILVGRAAVQMKHVATTLGCKVRMARHDGFDNRLVIVIGTYCQCVVVQELLQARLADALRGEAQEPADQVEVIVMVRAEAAGVVIGKQGFKLNQIRRQSGASIKLLHEQVKGQRPCILSGTLPNVLRAERHIFHLVSAVPAAAVSPAPGGPDRFDLPWSPPPLSPAPPTGATFVATPFPSPSPLPSP